MVMVAMVLVAGVVARAGLLLLVLSGGRRLGLVVLSVGARGGCQAGRLEVKLELVSELDGRPKLVDQLVAIQALALGGLLRQRP